MAPVVTTATIILSSNKIQNEDILYQLTQVHLEKWPLKHYVCVCDCDIPFVCNTIQEA